MRHKRILFWDDERSIDNSLIVTLKHGYKFSADPQSNEHVRGFDTIKDAMHEVKSSIKCNCESCLKQ